MSRLICLLAPLVLCAIGANAALARRVLHSGARSRPARRAVPWRLYSDKGPEPTTDALVDAIGSQMAAQQKMAEAQLRMERQQLEMLFQMQQRVAEQQFQVAQAASSSAFQRDLAARQMAKQQSLIQAQAGALLRVLSVPAKLEPLAETDKGMGANKHISRAEMLFIIAFAVLILTPSLL